MNGADAQTGLTPIAWTRSDAIGALQAHLGDRPSTAEAWYCLGVALDAQGRHEEAAAALDSALTLSPNDLAAQCAYAVALSAIGAVGQAVELLEDAISRSPGQGWAYFHLAAVRYRQGDLQQALQLWDCAARLLDDPTDCLENLAMVRRRLGDLPGERRCWQLLAQHDPANPIASHMLSAVGLTPAPPRAQDAYVTGMFDRFAPDFDRVLGQLRYSVPDLCGQWMQDRFGPAARELRVLDAGCGTGMCGQRLRPWAAELVGVDLSAGMLEHAARRGVYERLERAELVEFLRSNPNSFDVVVAGDVLCYFGDLGDFAHHAMGSLRAGGWLGFSVERAAQAQRGQPEAAPFVLQHHGRYAHTCQHVRHVLNGAALSLTEFVLRLELGQPVAAYWVSARRT